MTPDHPRNDSPYKTGTLYAKGAVDLKAEPQPKWRVISTRGSMEAHPTVQKGSSVSTKGGYSIV